VTAFGQYLRGGAALNGFALVDIIALAKGAKGEDASGYRADFIGLARLAQALPEACSPVLPRSGWGRHGHGPIASAARDGTSNHWRSHPRGRRWGYCGTRR